MLRFRGLLGACLLAGALAVTSGASAASASTFFVNAATGNDANSCTSPSEPCKSIGKAVEESEAVPEPATIEVASGVYQEELNLAHAADNGIVINGAGSSTVVEGPTVKPENPTIRFGGPSSVQTLSNLSVVNPVGDEEDGIEAGSNVTLDNVSIDMRNPGSGDGITAGGLGGSLTVNGGSVTMENGTTGTAVIAQLTPLTLNGTAIALANGATGSGVIDIFGPTTLTNVTIGVGNAAKGVALETELGTQTLSNVSITVAPGATGPGFIAAGQTSLTATDLNVAMENPASGAPGVIVDLGNGATFERLRVAGAWTGSAFEDVGAPATILDSHLSSGPTSTAPTLLTLGAGEGRGPLVQRSVIQAAPTVEPAAVLALDSNATFDSSEVLGGKNAVMLEHNEGKVRTLTIAGSTLDAGVLGERDAGEAFDVVAAAEGKGNIADVNVQGSILLERQKATVATQGTANVACSYSDAPNQTQPATAAEGTIACANGASGNTTTEPLSALFSAPISSYGLLPGSSAIDSVPASAISLPFGIAPSATDLAGNPRVLDGNGDCVGVQDKGALELVGFAKACPTPPPPPPAPASITNLSIAPNAFFAAPSGATIAKAHKKRKYGATVSWRDTLAATTTFTVIRETKGRKQGKSCKKPSKHNRHGKSCTILTAIGSFTHLDVAGANKVHFSGRLNGKKLSKGSYVLQAVPRTAAGNGKAVKRQFKIKG